MQYTLIHIARAYQAFRKLSCPYYSAFDANGSVSQRLEKYFLHAANVFNSKSIDIVDYLKYLYESQLMPMPNALHSNKLIHKYEEFKELHQPKSI